MRRLLATCFLLLSAYALADEPKRPACPETLPSLEMQRGENTFAVEYDPSSPGALLKEAREVSVFLVANSRSTRRQVPLRRDEDGVWRGRIPMEWWWDYVLYYFYDENKRIDTNAGKYWELLVCKPFPGAVVQALATRAESFAGTMNVAGLQRPVDYDRTVAMLRELLAAYPKDRRFVLHQLWRYELLRGGKRPAAYARVRREIRDYIARHRGDQRALFDIGGYITFERKLGARLRQDYFAALRRVAPDAPWFLAEEFKQVEELERRYPDQPERWVPRYLALVPRDRHNWHTGMVYPQIFYAYTVRHPDPQQAELAFQRWHDFDPQNPDPYGSMARFLLDQGSDRKRALELIERAKALFGSKSPPLKSRMGITVFRHATGEANLAWLRGRALVANGRPAEALEELKRAVAARPDDYRYQLALGEACEAAGQMDDALAAYLEAATSPSQSDGKAYAGLRRAFAASGGTEAELERRLEQRIAERRRKVAEEYLPVPVLRELPAFDFRDLSGRTIRSRNLPRKPVVINLWAVYCAPCIPELHDLERFAERNPQVEVYAVSLDTDAARVRELAAKRGFTRLKFAVGGEKLRRLLGGQGVPVTAVLDRQGTLRYLHNEVLPDATAVLEQDLATLAPSAPRTR